MLTADLVHARRQGRELRLTKLDERARARAGELAASFLEIARAHVGRSREEVDEACGAIVVEPRDRRLADGIRKLVEDRCDFDAADELDPEALRRDVFLHASAARKAGTFERRATYDAVARERSLPAELLERALYADLRGAHLLKDIAPASAERLVDEYDLAQAQAVLLRAVRVTVEIQCTLPGAYRALFQKLKFLRLLYRIEERALGGYRIEIDGPFSLFESVTKYGLQLALALPLVRECEAWRLEAEVRWGKDRTPLTFKLEGPSLDKLRASAARESQASESKPRGGKGKAKRAPAPPPPPPSDEVAALLDGLRALDAPWKISLASTILDLPGVGLCVPDLVFSHRETGEVVYLEVLGFWSRAAVWRRVELIEKGLGERVLFAVSKHLRVSEEALADDAAGALYLYKRVMNARAVLERIEALCRRVIR